VSDGVATDDRLTAAAFEPYDPFIHTSASNVYEIYAALREHHPVYYSEARNCWCLTRHADVQAASRNLKAFSNRPGVALDAPNAYGRGDFLDDDPPHHDVLRNIVRPFFTPKVITMLASEIRNRTMEILAELRECGSADLAADFAIKLPIWVISRLLGTPEADDADIQRMVLALEVRTVGDPDVPPIATAALKELHEYLADLAKEKRRRPDDRVMSGVVAAAAAGELEADEVVGMASILFSAGAETTYALLGNVLAHLADTPEALHSLRADMSPASVEATIEESLRFENPVQYSARTATEATEWHGVEIPSGARTLLVWAAGSRDPSRWERPDEFDIHRTSQLRHMAFGEGIHFCLGGPLARLEARIALPLFLETFSDYDIRTRKRRPNHMVRGWDELGASLVVNPAS
jgi:cytochrome P450